MSRHTTGLAFTVAAAAVLICFGSLALPILGSSTAQAACGITLPAETTGQPEIKEWNAVQQQHARTIVTVGRQDGLPPRAWVVALATAMQESSLFNHANSRVPRSLQFPHDKVGDDHDSLGLFQQRVSPPDGHGTWGAVNELMTPATSARKFYDALSNVDGWQQMRLTEAAQAVQRSAYPEAYQKWEPVAEKLVAQLVGVGNVDDIGGGTPLAPCGAAGFDPVAVGSGGWIQPVHADIVSPFGIRDGRMHAGVDLGASRNTPIRAASAGIIIKVRCESGSGTCDRDGGVGVGGCGWYVEIRHPSNIVTRYCHMVQRPEAVAGQNVTAGDVIGFVGSSGNSSGPHLHFEVHVRREALSTEREAVYEPVDPVAFLAQRGVKLGAD
jgi:murein DD-endopeptidase MepM/ murein hydrolase activator NlpD